MNKFKLGTNFDFALLDAIKKENDTNERGNTVQEVYGSIRAHASLAARPDFRLPVVSNDKFIEYVRYAKERGINFNYTLNSIQPMENKLNFEKHAREIIDLIEWFAEIGVYRITIANPMLLELVKRTKHHPLVEISTIAHIDTITQIRYFFETYGVTKICANVNKNRNFKWLEKAAKYCNDNNIELELMANEFCGVGGKGYATHCIYRDSCYICHSTNKDEADAKALDSYPMKQCTMSRNSDPANWLKVKFIRPEDLKVYNDIGIHNFKLTGRTASTEYLVKVLHAYMTENWEGNLLGLWKPLESITHEKDESFTSYNIPNKALDNFINIWSKSYHDCDNEICGQTCQYCQRWYEEHVKELQK